MEQVTELWQLFLRRFWLIAIVSTLGIVAATFYAYIKPATYEAQATILIESQQIRDDLAPTTVTATAEERLRTIQQRLMSRNNLQNLIAELNLFARRRDLTVGEQIATLREATRIRPDNNTNNARNRRARQNVSISAFTITVTYDHPGKAAKIANRFATIVLDQNLKARETQATETLKYFTGEVERVQAEVRALEEEVSAFKNANKDALPESLAYRQTELTQLNATEQELERRVLELEEQRSTLLLALEANPPAQQASPEEIELRRLKSDLAQKGAVLSSQHREIRGLRARIAALERSIAETNQVDGEDFQTAKTKHQIKQIQEQIVLVKQQMQQLQERRLGVEESLRRTPGVEIQLNALNRRLQAREQTLAELNKKRIEAETGERLEVNRQGENFELIEEAVIPDFPVSPDRKKIAVMGSGVSIALAFALAFLLDILRPRIRSAAQMERSLDLRPVVTIPYVRTRGERWFRTLKIASLVLLIGAGLPATLYQIDQKYMPLELLAEKIADKSGLDQIIQWTEARF